ncbi:hypothetical protein [Geobacter sp. AOG1]|uniref:hypothetical protein n=1 Tax=Geobacter sp. AOG1 TaxID=1566346 RepID=UPI001CC46F6C|nr:hypothetical protein [Geobacter sp. AOG1]GFE56541.1 hypothetical protein AOG1_04200 [Geobacter sp. AOG1]
MKYGKSVSHNSLFATPLRLGYNHAAVYFREVFAMRVFLISCLLSIVVSSAASGGEGVAVPGATEEAIAHDCRVTAELAVELLKMKAKTPPEKMVESAGKLLSSRGYKSSFGDAEFIARFYTGMALQSGPEVDKIMAEMPPDDLALMVDDHEILCLKGVYGGGSGSGQGHGGMGGMSH